jgi:hypothetical protein
MVWRKDLQPEGAERVRWVSANSVAKGERMYLLKVQSKYDESDREWHGKWRRYIHTEGAEGEIAKGMAKGERTYSLKVQSRYDVSDREWRATGRNDVQPEDAEGIRWVR